MELLWSTEYDENICENFYECKQCCEDYACCHDDTFNYDYDSLNEIIDEDLNNMFGENNYEYMVVGVRYMNYYGLNSNDVVGGYSDLYRNVSDIIDKLSDGCGICSFRIFLGKYNKVFIERSHHDGKELFLLCRLNSVGYKYLENYYDFDRCKYIVKGVIKDFDYFK